MATALSRGISSQAARRLLAHSRFTSQPHRLVVGSTSCVRWFSSYPPHEVVGMPSLSPTMESGAIASWSKNEGESFGAGDILCSVETDKATVDFEAQDEGIVAKILAPAGPQEIRCGEPILITVEEQGDVAAFADYQLDAAAAAATPTPTKEPETAPAVSPPPPAAASVPPPAPAVPSEGRVVASPLAHMLSKEMGYDISKIPGTGPGGRIIAADVREFAPELVTDAAAAAAQETPVAPVQSTPPPPPPVAGLGYTDFPISASARETAMRLSQSKQNVPHYYLTVDICMDELLALRASLNETLGESPIGVYELLIKAAAAAMKAVPSANASWMDSVVRVYDSVDINVVTGSGDSLRTPVLLNCGGRGLKDISNELAAVDSAQDGIGTFTVINLGMYGVKTCAPIIREPQAAALALGALENRIVPNDDENSEEIYKESVMMTATTSFDHRVVDGAVGAEWLSAFKSHVENPSTLLL